MTEDKEFVSNSADAGTRDKIIAAAISEFAEHGLSGARVDRIAHRAAINKAMIYYYFQSKDNLYHQAVRQVLLGGANRLKKRLDEAANIEEVLNEFVALHTYMFNDIPGFRTMALRELAEPDGYLLDHLASLLSESGVPAALQRHFQEGTLSGSIRAMDHRQLMAAFLSLSIGYHLIHPMTNRVLGIVDKDKFMQARAKAIIEIFLNGVRTR